MEKRKVRTKPRRRAAPVNWKRIALDYQEDCIAALRLLAPVSPEETLLGAIRNKLQAELTAMENSDEAMRQLAHARGELRAAEEALVAMTVTLAEARGETRAVRQELAVSEEIGDTFWEALKPLNLKSINVQNPGQHVTDLIFQVTRWEMLAKNAGDRRDDAISQANAALEIERAKIKALEERCHRLHSQLAGCSVAAIGFSAWEQGEWGWSAVHDDIAKLYWDLREAKAAAFYAFVAGAKWWEFEKTGATMWTSDTHKADAEAQRRYPFAPHPLVRVAEIRAEKAERELQELRGKVERGEFR